jgi:uncharacterized protein (TIGR00730 family)
MEIRSLCVLCGSHEGIGDAYREAALRLGRLIAQSGLRLVYGGGSVGLMGAVATGVMGAGGEVVGVIPEFLIRAEAGNTHVSELIVTESMHDRKRRMFEMSDAFAVLPGGLGTLDETFEIITWKQLRLHHSPIIVIDIEGYWAPLSALIEATVTAGFAHPDVRDLIQVVTSPEEALALLSVAGRQERAFVSDQL